MINLTEPLTSLAPVTFRKQREGIPLPLAKVGQNTAGPKAKLSRFIHFTGLQLAAETAQTGVGEVNAR